MNRHHYSTTDFDAALARKRAESPWRQAEHAKMTTYEFEDALWLLIDDYAANPGNGTLGEIARILENTAILIRKGKFDNSRTSIMRNF